MDRDGDLTSEGLAIGEFGIPSSRWRKSGDSALILYPFFQRIVRRARDAGMGKAIAYWSIFPGVVLFTSIFLLLKGSSKGGNAR